MAEKNPATAAAVLAYFLDFNLTNWNLNIAKGMQIAIDWERGQHGRVEHEKNAFESLRKTWDVELGSQSEKAEQLQKRLDTLIERADSLLSAQKKRFDKSIESYDERLENTFKKTTDELENITRAYDEKLALHASVRYWGLQEKYHKKMSIGFGIATVIVAVLVLLGLYQYADHFLAANISTIQISKLVTAAILTTFGIWAVRTCANLFMSHTHLRTDAQERRTMIHTYLALLRKGQGPKDDERQLILQTLFRPSTTGMIKDDAGDRKSTRLNSSHIPLSRMPSSA